VYSATSVKPSRFIANALADAAIPPPQYVIVRADRSPPSVAASTASSSAAGRKRPDPSERSNTGTFDAPAM
jgi:hypothetical protein